MALQSAKKMLLHAFKNQYAIAHININNLEWTKAALEVAQSLESPIILAVSEGAVKYMGGYKTVFNLVKNLDSYLQIDVPVALHLDHGTYEGVKNALEAGFSSVMYDGSHQEFAINYQKTATLLKLVKNKNISFEAEVGTIGGEEDGIIGNGEKADPLEAQKMSALGVDVLACGIGNIHGPYPASWKSLDFTLLKKLSETLNKGIVLHGGSGIPEAQIKKAITLGVTKINVNTEIQQANAAALKDFIVSGKIDEGKNFDPRKIYGFSSLAMKKVIAAKMKLFGSVNQAPKIAKWFSLAPFEN